MAGESGTMIYGLEPLSSSSIRVEVESRTFPSSSYLADLSSWFHRSIYEPEVHACSLACLLVCLLRSLACLLVAREK